ncbi:hypothetical protein IWQ60_004544 [Tieghemiomyces parasiticus]|uniref:MT-A70-domain-containing protein n=1 Tax=Tieghemiomyces parasiticus TaxID=78921 RepID=A0A9W8DZ21_9FUNG|nr:hypothetical protein IWQ60_004544 [Tieghemiomyces parasiticus]
MTDMADWVQSPVSLSSRKRKSDSPSSAMSPTPSLPADIDDLAQLLDDILDGDCPPKRPRSILEASGAPGSTVTASLDTIILDDSPVTSTHPLALATATAAAMKKRSVASSPHRKTTVLPPVRRSGGQFENVFTRDQVKAWSAARIHAWNIRHTNPEAYYYRFVDPTEGQSNGGFNAADHQAFMARLEVWRTSGYRIGSAWGLFSKGVPHKAGYMCSSYYRKLLEQRKLVDDAYGWVDGKLVMVNKQRPGGGGTTSGGVTGNSGAVPDPTLSERWETEELKTAEAEIDGWIREFHGDNALTSSRLGLTRQSKPISSTTKPAARAKATVTSSSLTKASPTVASPPSMPAPSKPTSHDRFKAPYVIPNPEFKQRMRQLADIRAAQTRSPTTSGASTNTYTTTTTSATPSSLPTPSSTTMGTIIRPRLQDPDFMVAPPRTKATQIDLSKFWSGVKAPEAPMPEPIYVRLPNVIPTTWAKPIVTLEAQQEATPESTEYLFLEVDRMVELEPTVLADACRESRLDDPTVGEKSSTAIESPALAAIVPPSPAQLELASLSFDGILVDPPWTEAYVEDQYRNCFPGEHVDGDEDTPTPGVTVSEVGTLLARVLPCLPRGMVFLWTHKAILPAVVEMMAHLDCRYVENLIWFKKRLNHTHHGRPSPYIRTSKETLLLFKKGEGFDIRHQRSADVIIDFARPVRDWIYHDWTEPRPDAVYEMIETLLPNAAYDHELGRGRLLELWANRDIARRSGWVYVREPKRGFEMLEDPYQALQQQLQQLPREVIGVATEASKSAPSPSSRFRSLVDLRTRWRRSQLTQRAQKAMRSGSSWQLCHALSAPAEPWLVPRRLHILKELDIASDDDPKIEEVTKEIVAPFVATIPPSSSVDQLDSETGESF